MVKGRWLNKWIKEEEDSVRNEANYEVCNVLKGLVYKLEQKKSSCS